MRLLSLFLVISCGGTSVETGSELESLRHDVEYDIEEGVARLNVRRAFRGIEGELDRVIALPSAGAVDRFRFAFNDRWYDGDLLDAELASERYELLSGLAGEEGHAVEGAPPPALLAYESDGSLRVRAHPLAPEDTIELEVRIVLPTCHANGRAIFDYPVDETDPASFFGAGLVRAPYETEDFEAACDDFATILSEERVVIEQDPLSEIFAGYAVQPLGERHAMRIAIDAPPELAPIPVAPSVVFVFDGSYSHADEDLADQIAWAKAYLAWVPDAVVEIVVFRREAERLFGRFVRAQDFVDAMTSTPKERLALGNGSFLEKGLALAASIVEGGGAEKRIVAMSDMMMRDGFDIEAARVAAGGSAILHLVTQDRAGGEPTLAIENDELFDAIPNATGGVYGTLSGDPNHERAVAIAEELVHPIRLEGFVLPALEASMDYGLERGRRIRMTALLSQTPPDRIELRPRLWSKTVPIELLRSNAIEEAMPAILVATAPGLSDDEVRHVAQAGGVVSRVTSYLAERGGVDPIAPPDQFGNLFGIHGHGISGFSCGCCGGAFARLQFDHGWLEEQVRQAASTCGAVGATLTIETTFDEIADVEITASTGADCLSEAIWSLRLPEDYRTMERHLAHMTVPLNL